MPLSQHDPALDYDGSWVDASESWPYIHFQTEVEAKDAYVRAWRDVKIPYGCYVLVGHDLRLETKAQMIAVFEHITRLGARPLRTSFGVEKSEEPMKTLDPVTIIIRGKHDTGKTTLARLLEQFLQEHDYRHMAVTDLPPLPHDQKDRFSNRFERNRSLRPVIIRVELEEAAAANGAAVSP